MTFLQPFLLAALPLISLPIIIHLINQRRYQTIRWAAMIFLLAANRMSRGYAKLRQMLILLFRMLAIAGLIFAVSRPLAGGWLGRAGGGRPDTTIVLLDRSPSMRQQGLGTVVSKLEAGRHQLARTLAVLGSGRWVLIESTTNTPREIESPDALVKLAATEPAATSADLPAMLEAARDYIRTNRAGSTEIWICSDLRQNDWQADSARWQALRDSLLEFPQSVRIHLLAYPEPAAGNVGVRVTNVRRQQTADGAELLLSLKLTREDGGDAKLTVPLQFDIEGARSEVTIEMNGPTYEVKDQRIPIERSRERGWGKVSIPADANPADNDFYFVFDRPQPRKTLIVSDDVRAVAPIQLAASISPDSAVQCSAEVITREQLASVEWDEIGLVVWHAPLPLTPTPLPQGERGEPVSTPRSAGERGSALQPPLPLGERRSQPQSLPLGERGRGEGDAQLLLAFINRGGQVLFVPPRSPSEGEFLSVRWQNWIEEEKDIPVETWRGDQDILANTQSGAALPVGRLQIRRVCAVTGEQTPLATLRGGRPLLSRVPTNRGGVYFLATTTDPADSSLASNGVVLYALVHRALAAGAAVLGQTRQVVAGDPGAEQPTTWQQLAGAGDAISTDYVHHTGIYRAGEKLFAVNRSPQEDQAAILKDDRVAELFQRLDFTRVDDRAGSLASLIQEIWRPFLVVMLTSLLVEAGLCMPRRAESRQQTVDSRQ